MSPALESNGLLPPGIHRCTGGEIKATFVDKFPGSTTRPKLIDGWRLHRRALAEISSPRHQWVDGSFVTSKQDPADIDVASFLDGLAVDALEPHMFQLLRVLTGGNYTRQAWGCDSYLVTIYPSGHVHHDLYRRTRDYWKNWFGRTRDGRQKGFLEVANE